MSRRQRIPRDAHWRDHVAEASTGCLLWLGHVQDNGYASRRIGHPAGRLVHRQVYWDEIGPIPDGLTIDHVRARGCRYKHCVNPAHLEAVTIGDNLRRADTFSGINFRKTHCRRGHVFDAVNTYVDPRGHRRCRACHRARDAERRALLAASTGGGQG